MTADIFLEGVDLGREADFLLGPLRVSPSAREVDLDGAKEMLEPRVMQALVALVRRQGEVVSRDALTETCWEGRIVGDDAINRVMGKLRRLGMETGAFVLETVPRVGYRLILSPGQTSVRSSARRLPRRGLVMAAAIILLAAAGWLGWGIWTSPLTPQTPVAVLPFTVSNADPAAAAFAANAHREIAAIMTANKISLAAPGEGGRRLEITSEVRAEAGRLHAVVQLRDPRARVVLWVRDFTASSQDPARLSHEIGWRLTSVMHIAHDALEYRGPGFDTVALGYWIQIQDEVVQGTWNMISPNEALVRRAPRFAGAHAGQAMSYLARASFASPAEAPELRAKAKVEIERTRALDPSTPWAVIQATATDSNQWAERERLIREGWPQFPGEPLPNQALAQLMIGAGRLRDGTMILNQTPPSRRSMPGVGGVLVTGLNLMGQKEEAVAAGERYRAMRPSDAMLKRAIIIVAFSQGDYARAEAILADPDLRPGALPSAGLDALRAAAKAGRTGAAADRSQAVQMLVAAGDKSALARWMTIPLISGLGAVDEAFAVANAYAEDPRMMKQGVFFDPSFLYAPETRIMRADRRFVPLAEKLGLLRYWRETGKWPDFCETEPASVCAAMKAGG